MSMESEMRRQMEIAAAQQASGMQEAQEGACPIEEDVEAAFGFRQAKKRLNKALSSGKKSMDRKTVVKKTGGKGMIFQNRKGM